MSLTRRSFLASFSSALALSQLPSLPAFAAAGDYRALVCIFLFGGNDGNNMVVPVDGRYADYRAVRGDGSSGGIGLPLASVMPLAQGAAAAQFGLHPQMAALGPVWDSGELALLFNSGTLLRPTTAAAYRARSTPLPMNLFSHLDQQIQAQSSISGIHCNTGWGGRMADALAGINLGAALPMVISTSGNVQFTAGNLGQALAIPASGSFGLAGVGGGYASGITAQFNKLLSLDRNKQSVIAAQNVVAAGEKASSLLTPILTGASVTDAAFASLNTGIANQLHQVARVIGANASLGLRRQVFFVGLGSFDTHAAQISTQANLLGQLAAAMRAFNDAMHLLGTSTQVTSFTLSDFARTLKPNSGGGSDHAWGNHQLIMGGAVRGRNFYGKFPSLALNGADDADGEGRWVPSTSIDQYAATLAQWFGVSSAAMPTVLPNIGSFATADLGFMQS